MIAFGFLSRFVDLIAETCGELGIDSDKFIKALDRKMQSLKRNKK